MASGSPTAGKNYTLECSTGGSIVESFQWLVGPLNDRAPVIESTPRLSIMSNTTTSQLQFRPVQQSDNGSYSCNASVDGSALLSEMVDVSVNGTIIPNFCCTTM